MTGALLSTDDLARSLSAWSKAKLVAEIVGTYADVCLRWRRTTLQGALIEFHRQRDTARPAVPDAHAARLASVRLGIIVKRILSLLPGDTRCLTRSLVLTAMLSRRGIDSTFIIGVRTEPEFAAHAWVEYEGKPLIMSGHDVYRRLAEI